MKIHPGNCQRWYESPQRGVALVLTLLIISMLVVVVVGFVSVSRLEQMAARNYTYQAAAEQMAQLATGQAMERLSQAMQAGVAAGAYATQSGRVYPAKQNPQALFSEGGNNTNINSLASYGLVTSVAGDNISVGMPVATIAGQAVGRTAFYIADETAKLPINFASPGRPTLNPLLPRPFSIKGVGPTLELKGVLSFSNILSGNFSNNTISNWSYFFTPEQFALAVFGVGEVLGRRVTVATATNQLAPLAKPKTPWGTDKILINQEGLDESSLTKLTNAMTDTNLTKIFGRHFGNKYGEEGLQQLAANMLQLRSDHWEPTRMFQGTNPIIGTADLTNAVAAPAPNSGDLKKTNGIPQKFFGYVPFPMLREVAVHYDYGWTTTTLMTVRFFVECTLYNPYPEEYSGEGVIVAQVDKAIFAPKYEEVEEEPDELPPFRGPFGTPGEDTAYPYNDSEGLEPWGSGAGFYDSLEPANGIVIKPIGTVPPKGVAYVILEFDLNFEEDNPTARPNDDPQFWTRFIIDQIRVLADANDPKSARDWVSGYDFFNALADTAEGPAQFDLPPHPRVFPKGLETVDDEAVIVGNAELTFADSESALTKLVKQYDPRLRLPLDVAEPYQTGWPGKIWFEVPYEEEFIYTPGASPNPALTADPGFAGDPATAIYNPDIPPRLAFSSSSNSQDESSTMVWSMPADLGKVFTGVPWRSLRMQPQPAEEGNAIPDWVVLDMVDFTDGTKPLTTVNPNSSYSSAGGTVAGFGAGLRSQLDVLTNATARTNVANPLVPTETAPNPAKLTPGLTNNLSISNLVTQAGNLQWSSSGSWGGRRAAMGFPTNALLLPSEIVEIAGFADYAGQGDNFKLNEYRIGTLFPGLSTKSRFFKIYAVGEAFEGTTTQNVAATALLQTLVEVDDSTDPISITTIYQYPPAD